MLLTANKLPKNLIEITAELSILEMAPFYNQTLEQMAQDAEIPGFRKGKAPLEMIKQRVDEMEWAQRAAEIAIDEKYPEIVKKSSLADENKKIELAGAPQIQIQKLAPNNPLVFKLTFPLVPEVKIGNYRKIRIKRNKIEIKADKIKKALEELRQSRGREVLVNRPAELNDRVQVDLDLFVDKVPVENGQIKNLSLILGRENYLPGLSENLKGLRKDEEKIFSFPYPNSHYDRNLAGKLVDFKAKIKNVYQIDLPTLDDAFAQGLGNFKNLKELENKIKENLEIEEKNKEEQRLETTILKDLVAKSTIDEIPEILIEHELDKMIDELKGGIELNGGKFDDYLQSIKKTISDLRKDFAGQAQERIRTALCIRQIAKQEKISANDEEIEKEIKNLTDIYKKQTAPAEYQQILDDLKTEKGRLYLKNMLTNKKVIEWLKNNLTD